jgi:hypothetical protein
MRPKSYDGETTNDEIDREYKATEGTVEEETEEGKLKTIHVANKNWKITCIVKTIAELYQGVAYRLRRLDQFNLEYDGVELTELKNDRTVQLIEGPQIPRQVKVQEEEVPGLITITVMLG